MRKISLIICGLCCILSTYSQNTTQVTEIQIAEDPVKVKINGHEYQVHEYVDQFPEYPGGINALMQFLSDNIRYPQSAMGGRIQGKVLVNFIVGKDGNEYNAEIAQSVDPALDAEALRVVKLLKGYRPAKIDGKTVNVWYTLPINSRLQDDYPAPEAFDAVEIDSIGYKEMMNLGIKAQSENNRSYATAYFF